MSNDIEITDLAGVPAKPANAGAENQLAVQTAEVVKIIKSTAKDPAEPIRALEPAEATALEALEQTIISNTAQLGTAFQETAKAYHEIRRQKLHLGSHTTFAEYCKVKFGIQRSHAYRLSDIGEMLASQSPEGTALEQYTSQAHFRPMLALNSDTQDVVVDLVQDWADTAEAEITPRLVKAAAVVATPPAGPSEPKNDKLELVKKFVNIIEEGKDSLPEETDVETSRVFKKMLKRAKALGGPKSTTGIDWTKATWNPLQGCTRASAGCDHCYAAKLIATRLAKQYPGLAIERKSKGKKTYAFTGVIKLLPEKLAEPLEDRIPKRYFANSMSDLFHADVPEEFISAVFDVMEKAHWHTFQVLTKRPERMAEFSTARYGEETPPANIWLGTSTENQEAFDERYPHLLNTKAAVRWLSVEPLIGPIEFSSMEGIDWVVVGGESDSDRKMEKDWVIAIRDACEANEVAFFFKQWGEYNEEGIKESKAQKKDGSMPLATLDGETYDAYPGDNDTEADVTAQGDQEGAKAAA